MRIPDQLSKLIQPDHELSSFVNSAIAAFEPWVAASQLPFFPEYTDHSIVHIEEVMQTAVELATDEAWTLLSNKDAALLILAICLHDCAMHLTEDGFLSLIAPDNAWRPIAGADTTSWNVLWDDFFAEARRFDGRKLIALFGDTDPVRRPPRNINDLSKRDRLLIGEFIRRHHARLAHEIACYGIPGAGPEPTGLITQSTELKRSMADISGAVARSHGIPLRKAVDYIKEKYHVRDYNGIHAVFLMVLVRIADYLQIQAKRAPTELLEIRKLTSPVSQGEWKVHACIRNITRAVDDPEAIYVDANPPDVRTFLRVREWLSGIQDELDLSWAVIGEVYGRYRNEKLDRLRVQLRRVRSNLDNIDEFSKTVQYVPAQISFETANPDLLKLLVGPLYGDDPGIGLRELIQNAVDAVRELDELVSRQPSLKEKKRREQDEDVEIVLECNEKDEPISLTVSDRGIGMNLDIVQNYFLKAGASFRRSDAWRKTFEGESGHSKVLRSGRFGVGVLAAFLVGNEIEVTTRHIESPADNGIAFTANLDEPAVSLRWVACPVGTEVHVKIPPDRQKAARDAFEPEGFLQIPQRRVWYFAGFGQYFGTYPSVKRTIRRTGNARSEDRVVKQDLRLPSENSPMARPWRRFKSEGYSNIFWSYSRSLPELCCNGLVVRAIDSSSEYGEDNLLEYKFLRLPALLVYDRDGKLPLNLQRTGLANKNVGFSGDLASSVTNDLVAYALLTGPNSLPRDATDLSWLKGKYAGFSSGYASTYGLERIRDSHRWFVTNLGFGLLDADLVLEKRPRAILMAFRDRAVERESPILLGEGSGRFLSDGTISFRCNGLNTQAINDQKFLVRSLLELAPSWGGGLPMPLYGLRAIGKRVFIRNSLIEHVLNGPSLGAGLKAIITEAKNYGAVVNSDWLVAWFGDCPEAGAFDFDGYIGAHAIGPEVGAIAEWYINFQKPKERSPVAARWMSLLNTPTIPFNRDQRKAQFARVYEELQPYISLIEEELARKGTRNDSDDDT